MRLSTSHKLTTSTGATCTSRSKSLLPYQPVPIRPTRGLRCANSSAYPRDFVPSAAVNANPLPACRNSRRFMDGLLEKGVFRRLPLLPSADGPQAYDTWAILPSAVGNSLSLEFMIRSGWDLREQTVFRVPALAGCGSFTIPDGAATAAAAA